MKNAITYLDGENKRIPLMLDMNVMAWAQEQYGSIDAWQSMMIPADGGEPNLRVILVSLREMINEAVDYLNDINNTNDPLYSEKAVGRLLTEVGLEKAVEGITEATVSAVNTDEKNAETQQTANL